MAARDLLKHVSGGIRAHVSDVTAAVRTLGWAAANPGKWWASTRGAFGLAREMSRGGLVVPAAAALDGRRDRPELLQVEPEEAIYLSSLVQLDADIVLKVDRNFDTLGKAERQRLLDRHFKDVEDALRPLYDLGALGTLLVALLDLAGGILFIEGLARSAVTGSGWQDMVLGPALMIGGRGFRWLSVKAFDWRLRNELSAVLSRL